MTERINIGSFWCEFEEEMGMTSVVIEKAGFCSTLDFAEMHGFLLHDNGNTYPVPSYVLSKIKRWAENMGY